MEKQATRTTKESSNHRNNSESKLRYQNQKLLAEVFGQDIPVLQKIWIDFFGDRISRKHLSTEDRKAGLVEKLVSLKIDPLVFDVLLSNEINRRLKKKFGYWFLFLTFLFTAASYTIVVLDGTLDLNINDVAITALIIEAPIQFIGLLYIIARNLFPDMESPSINH